MQHDRRRFVPNVDFITTPGYLTGPGARERAGLPERTGPLNVVSTLGLMDFDRRLDDNPTGTCRMRLFATHPGVSVEEVVSNTGFDLIIPDDVGVNEPPTHEELRILREEIDPGRLYI
jgi:glutaconate CoA-transferase subunit B